jgi:2-oxoglutarate ferredoxin oxidoreductase subunit delta
MAVTFKVAVDFEACRACGACFELCPNGVFSLGERRNSSGFAVVVPDNQEGCVGCLLCHESCPEGCIRVKPVGV